MALVPAEAAVPEVWTFVACQLVPDVVMWRWGRDNQERWLGRGLVRHAFGRLWWQAHVLVEKIDGDCDYRLIDRLSEADLNQVFLHLLVNTAQAIADRDDAQRGKIRLCTRLDGNDVVVQVSETHIGIGAFFTLRLPVRDSSLPAKVA